MFQLIVAVIAIALVIALTLASIFYGGEAFTKSSLKANVAAMVNQAQQISAAATLYKTDFAVDAPTVQALIDNEYLADAPAAPKIVKQTNGISADWALNPGNYAYIELGSDTNETCLAVSQNGVGTCAADQSTGTEFYQFKL